jgi:hypothetical protein
VVSGQWSVVSGQWSVVSGQWSVVSGQWSVVSKKNDLREHLLLTTMIIFRLFSVTDETQMDADLLFRSGTYDALSVSFCVYLWQE